MSLLFVSALIGNGFFTFFTGIVIETFLIPKKRLLSPVIFFFTPIFFMCLALLPGLGKIDDPGILKTCIAYLSAFITVLACYKDSIPRKIFFTFIGFLSVVPVEMAITVPMAKYNPNLYSLFAEGTYATPQAVSVMYILLFAYALVVLIIVAIAKRRRLELSNEALLYFFLIPMTQSFSLIFVLWKASVNNNIGSLVTWVLLGFTYILADIAVYKAVKLISKRAQTEQQNEFYAQQLASQLEHYESFSGYAEELRYMRHDFANQISVLKHLMYTGQNEEAELILNEMYDKMNRLKAISFSDNKIINALVFNKYQVMQKSGINFNAHLAIPEDIHSKMEISDLCRILGNLLDNAIEACRDEDETLPHDEAIVITLNVLNTGGHIICHCKNPILRPLVVDKQGNLLTSKSRSGHGNGLKILDEISTKYNGEVHINADEGMFDIKVSLQIPPRIA